MLWKCGVTKKSKNRILIRVMFLEEYIYVFSRLPSESPKNTKINPREKETKN